MLDKYYANRGWDRESGLLQVEKLREMGMEDLIPTLEKEGLLA